MYLGQKIRNLINGGGFLHSASGEAWPPERTQREFERLTRYLRGHCKPGDDNRVALHFGHEARFVLSILACLDAGVTFVPLKKGWPQARIDQILRLAKPQIALDETLYERIVTSDQAAVETELEPNPNDLAYIMFTSGSTGAPKGVGISRASYETFVRWLDGHFGGIEPSDRILYVADFTFDVSLLDVGLTITKQAQAYISQFNGNVFKLANEIEEFRISSLGTVPNNLIMLLQDGVADRVNLKSIKYLLLGGARFSYGTYESVFRKYREKFADELRVYNFYGPTEATVYTHMRELTGRPADDLCGVNVSIGVPFGRNSCVLLDASGQKIESVGQTGELFLGGKQLMAGYFRDPEQTRSVFKTIGGEQYYATGDLAFRAESGDYFIQGRLNETIKKRGFRVNLLDIDSYMQKVDSVQDCATIAIPDDLTENRLVAYVVLKSGESGDELRSCLKGILVDYQMPDEFRFVGSLPLNSSGKVCRKTLRETYSLPAS